MNWKRITYEKPKNYQEVLITRRGDYFIATFVEADNAFHCKNGSKILMTDDLRWMQLLPPQD